MKLPLAFFAHALGLSLPAGSEVFATGYVIDSREVVSGDLFLALPGERVDGHDYVAQAFAKGASAAIVERPVLPPHGPLLMVPNTLAALQEIAAAARRHWGGTVVGITGSAGKTSSKEALGTLLSAVIPTSRTTGNFNNHIGLPLSILRIADEARVAVLEMGMNHAGEIAALAAIAKPEIGVVTNVGYAHVENFSDGIDGVAAAKRELIEALPADGTAVLNADDERVRTFGAGFPGRVETFGLSEDAKTRATDVHFGGELTSFRIESQTFSSPLPGRIGVLNICAAVAVARLWGAPLATLAEAAAAIAPPKMRTERREWCGMTIWNDTYNSNPDAAKAMLDVLRDTASGRRIAVLGEMLELGQWAETLHREIGRYAVRSGVSVLLGIRGAARHLVESAVEAGLDSRAACFFDSPEQAGTYLKQIAAPGDTILFKGSRGTRVELALERFTE